LAGVTECASGVILDVDGTLVLSNAAHARAWAEVLSEAGYQVPIDDLQRLIGMGSDKLLPAAIGVDKDSALGKRLSERRKQVFQERYLPHLEPTPGARALLDRLRAEGRSLMIASSAEGDELQGLLAVCGASDLADRTPPPDQVEGSKPEPDVVQAALDRLERPAAAVRMLGDTPYDVEAAGRAGVGIIALRCGGWRDADLDGALAIYDDPADLLAHYATSPLACAP
jgi:phosphoglycolate phosphatase-like HAD superfamily hydrolase